MKTSKIMLRNCYNFNINVTLHFTFSVKEQTITSKTVDSMKIFDSIIKFEGFIMNHIRFSVNVTKLALIDP